MKQKKIIKAWAIVYPKSGILRGYHHLGRFIPMIFWDKEDAKIEEGIGTKKKAVPIEIKILPLSNGENVKEIR